MSMPGLLWESWRELSDEARLALARDVVGGARGAGHELGEPKLVQFGPAGDRQTVAIVEDVARQIWFSLVPGGRLEPGLGDDALARFWALERAWLEAIEVDADDAEPIEHEVPYSAASWSPTQLARGAPVDVPPILIAIQPLPARVLGTVPPKYSSRPLLTWPEARAAATRLGYFVPTSAQLEWATTAGIESLFYWGDELPEPMDPRFEPPDWEQWEDMAEDFASTYMALAASEMAPWPTSNRFGLQGAAGQPAWCEGVGGDGLVAGGADRYFPWQSCGEWLWLLSSLRVSGREIPSHQGAMLRPAISVGVSPLEEHRMDRASEARR